MFLRPALPFYLVLLLAPALYVMPLVYSPEAGAQEDLGVSVGVVDRQRILRESKAGQGIRSAFEAQSAKYREEIKAREDQLRKQQEELERQRTILSPDAFAEREAAFAKKVEQAQRDVADRNKKLERILSYGMQQIDVATLKIIAELADAHGYTLVLDKTQLLMVNKTLEFSDEVLEVLDDRVPSVPTSPPETSE